MVYLLLALAAALFLFALFKVIWLGSHLARGGSVSAAGMLVQPLYIGIAVALGFWLLSVGEWI